MTVHGKAPFQTRRPSRRALLTALTISALWSCADSTDVQLLQIAGTGVLFGQAYLDLDASGTFTTTDQPIVGALVELSVAGTAGVARTAITDSVGLFALNEVAVGSYVLALSAGVLGDSLQSLASTGTTVVLQGDTTRLDLGTTYPVLTLADALVAASGSRVFTSGVALNSRLNFGDGQVHLAGGGTYLRGLNVNRAGLTAGDSVRFLGTVIRDNGRPALRDVTAQILINGAVNVLPVETTTGQAYSANGGSLDAALVRIRAAEMSDTATTTAGHFRFWADDGSDSVEVWLRDFLSIDTSPFAPDSVFRISQLSGLLSPFDDGSGTVRWRLMPRGAGDITIEVKTADIGVSMALDTAQASLGDTVQVTVVARNNGPLTATGVQVRDTIPTALTFLSSTQTGGSYDSGSGVWALGSMTLGRADTLVIRMEVTNGAATTVNHIAESLGLTRQVDPNAGNNAVTVGLTIVP